MITDRILELAGLFEGESLEDKLLRLKTQYKEVKPEDIQKEKETFTPGIKIIGEGKDRGGLHSVEIFLINQTGKKYKVTFYSNPFQIQEFITKIENIHSFTGQMKTYQNFKKIALNFKSEYLGNIDG